MNGQQGCSLGWKKYGGPRAALGAYAPAHETPEIYEADICGVIPWAHPSKVDSGQVYRWMGADSEG